MKLVVVSTGWNCALYIKDYIQSLKIQDYTDFVVYLVDDGSTDTTTEVEKNAIGDDNRFHLIRNQKNKWKTANFVEIIRNKQNIDDQDVIIEIDADDKLSDSTVFSQIYTIYKNPAIWICGSRWMHPDGSPNKSWTNGRVIPEKARSNWRFSHMRSYRAFLFRAIKDADLKMNGTYHRAACDIGYTIPMLEMAGSEHYYFLNKITYVYRRHPNHSGTKLSSHGNNNLQRKTADHVMRLPKYKQLSSAVSQVEPLLGHLSLLTGLTTVSQVEPT